MSGEPWAGFAAGVKATLLLPDDTIIIQVGNFSVLCGNPSISGGGVYGSHVADQINNVPCRVYVEKGGPLP
jgi:hypothetical protein